MPFYCGKRSANICVGSARKILTVFQSNTLPVFSSLAAPASAGSSFASQRRITQTDS